MIRHAFEYEAPATSEAAQAMLTEGVRVLAGGTWVVPEMGAGRMGATRIVDLRHCGLDTVARDGDAVVIGANASYAQLLSSPVIAELAPMIATAAAGITGGWQLLYQGTLGGAACYATPTSDAPALLVALDAHLRLLGPGGTRTVPAREFFLGAFETVASADELLVAIVISGPGPGIRRGHGYQKVKRGDSSWPIATAAATVEADGSGVRSARLALGGIAPTPVWIEVGDLIAGQPRPVPGLASSTNGWVRR